VDRQRPRRQKVIRIERPTQVPTTLQTRGVAARQALCESVEAGEEPVFNQRIYGDPLVKQALVDMQNGKCAFCERRVNQDGDVEHFRPKKAVQQAAGQQLEKPGYYWLAYEWANLVLACSACNQRQKRNLFPLVNPESRVRSHREDISLELPLFLDPTREDPEEFIDWRSEIPYAKEGNLRAAETIESLGLRRKAIADIRKEALDLAAGLAGTIRLVENHPHSPKDVAVSRNLRSELMKMLSRDAEFSAMLRANVALPPMPENFPTETESS
jgi:uncharacterized protein (TIGR02646 family)